MAGVLEFQLAEWAPVAGEYLHAMLMNEATAGQFKEE
jgi:hypothetical protein